MNTAPLGALPMDLLMPWSKSLLMGAFGWTLIQSIRGEESLSVPFERLALGVLAFTFYPEASARLQGLSTELSVLLRHAGGSADLKTLVLSALQDSAQAPLPSGQSTLLNLPSLTEQVLRTGIWGALTMIVQWIFLLASLLLETAHDVFWKLLIFLFPMGCGLFPIFPRMLTNLALYAIELCLWMPILILIERITSEVGRTLLTREGSWGLPLIAVELVAVFLILSVPTTAHRFLSGAFAGDMGSQGSLIQTGRRWIAWSQSRALDRSGS